MSPVADDHCAAARCALAAAQWSSATGDNQAALDFAIKAREAREAHLDADAPGLGQALNAEAAALIALGRLDDADMVLRKAKTIADAKKSADPLLAIQVGFSRARLLGAGGQRDDAESMATDAALTADEDTPPQAKARREIVTWMKAHDMTAPPAGTRRPTPSKPVASPLPVSPG